MVSLSAPHVGHFECCCSFHWKRFLFVPQNSEFHLTVSICFLTGIEVKALESVSHAMESEWSVGMFNFFVQYDLVGDSVKMVYSDCLREEVIFLVPESEEM